ncbi:MAG: class I SAM-dependent methyltransferase [Candidatus Omnitrophota bacterium]|nr:class I SAM-dependent methyltransferase [Candidatus Omnitrophota bacterium]
MRENYFKERFRINSVEGILKKFLEMRIKEYKFIYKKLGKDDLAFLEGYGLSKLFLKEKPNFWDRFNMLRMFKGYSIERFNYSVRTIMENKRHLKILDAGCGLGTNSILFALLGADVWGIDIKKQRIDLAKERVKYYEREYDVRLDINFLAQNIFDLKGSFDVIFVNEAISHIHPAEEFLKLSYRLLKNNGEIIIADANGLNPFVQLHYFKKRGSKLYDTIIDSATGKIIPIANERIFNLYQIKKRLQNAKFSIKHIECFLPFASFTGRKVYNRIFLRLQKLPLFASVLGRAYAISGIRR